MSSFVNKLTHLALSVQSPLAGLHPPSFNEQAAVPRARPIPIVTCQRKSRSSKRVLAWPEITWSTDNT
ncbi:hypothetical protein PHLGIDRAFT_165258 [Phlebiopsis gigantea 11061_1 CR5-6]|uniref:Uncharacterized protein n=1 Tax=Phlebiopsis gigantea (strain 11061_1 CR5-6) TaxID=745531 RepID=A0A0C3NJP4_PHLG1|nr:hypothetical protein PHLGIDRAFT_165258 [Phlebiopsis gigantea 11061_1 CR5-6]